MTKSKKHPAGNGVDSLIAGNAKPRRLGFLEGAFDVPDDFNSLGGKKIKKLFHGQDVPRKNPQKNSEP